MKDGTPVNRAILVLLNDGTVAVDWGDGQFYDILVGKFRTCAEKDISHQINDAELDQLKLSGAILRYDQNVAYILHLPERRLRTMD
jgi:hypothetical protein